MTQLLTVQELAANLKVSKGTIYNWVSKGKVPHVYLPGNDLRFNEAAIERWLLTRSINGK